MHLPFSTTRPALIIWVVVLFVSLAPSQAAEPAPVRIIFDTDMETDCDDAGALAVLHALADNGECEILATVVSVRDPWSAATVDAINNGRVVAPAAL